MKNAHDIFRMLESQIRLGKLAPGAKLPPVRDLATSLHVDKNTVLSAYGKLREAGLTQSLGRGGTVVAEGAAPGLLQERSLPAGTLDLTHGNPAPEFLPGADDLQRVLTPAFLGEPPHLYDGVQVHPSLEALARAGFVQDGLPAGRIAVTGGAVDAIDRILRLCLSKGDAVAIERPCFPSIPSLVRSLGHTIVDYEIDEEGPVPASVTRAVEAGARAVILTPRAQNPCGASLSPRRGEALGRIAERMGGVLWIDDDHFSLLASEPYRPHFPLESGRWAVVRSVSKFLGPDFRLAWCTGDPKTMAALQANQWLSQRWQSHLLQRLAVGLLADPAMQAKIRAAGSAYRARRQMLADALAPLDIVLPRGEGLNVWLPVPGGEALVAWLLGRGIAVRGSQDFFGTPTPGFRVTLSMLDAAAVRLLCAALQDWRTIAWDVAQA